MKDNDKGRTYLQTPEQWTRFLSSFVHELRTPIASLRMLTDLLAEAPQSRLGEQERRYSESIRDVAQDLQALVGEVFFRLDADDGHLRVVLSSDGPPFEETALAALFEPFDDGVPAGRPRGGRSLALPLANELARALGGTLRAGNRGERPTFDLSLPAAGS